jgi:hypothetical protein
MKKTLAWTSSIKGHPVRTVRCGDVLWCMAADVARGQHREVNATASRYLPKPRACLPVHYRGLQGLTAGPFRPWPGRAAFIPLDEAEGLLSWSH